jgi:hypothetical protein
MQNKRMHAFIINIDEQSRKALLTLFQLFYSLPPWAWFLVGLCLLSIQIIAIRLCRFKHPKYSRLSTFVRHSAQLYLRWPTLLASLAGLAGMAILISLAYHFQVLPKVIESLTSRAIGLGVGVLAGCGLGGMAYYWLIPGLELPNGRLELANSKIPTLPSYDPERYFHG